MELSIGRNAQVNRSMEQLLQYWMNKKLIDKRQEGEMEYLAGQGKMYQGLEDTRAGNARADIKQKWIYEISQLPSVKRLASEIYVGESEGRDMAAKRNQFREEIKKPLQAFSKVAAGKEVDDQDWLGLVETFADEMTPLVLSAASTSRQKMAMPLEQSSQDLRKQEIAQGGQKLGLEWAKLEQDDRKLSQTQRDGWLDFVKEIEGRLFSEGVDLSKEYVNLTPDMRFQMSAGKIADPLTPEYRGAASQWLREIRTKLLAGQSISQADVFFMQRAGNSDAIRKQGFPNKETGLLKDEVAKFGNAIQDQTITEWDKAVQRYIMKYGLTQQQAEERATRLFGPRQ